jgi:hypothetical protein
MVILHACRTVRASAGVAEDRRPHDLRSLALRAEEASGELPRLSTGTSPLPPAEEACTVGSGAEAS